VNRLSRFLSILANTISNSHHNKVPHRQAHLHDRFTLKRPLTRLARWTDVFPQFESIARNKAPARIAFHVKRNHHFAPFAFAATNRQRNSMVHHWSRLMLMRS